MTHEEAKNWLNKLFARTDITDEYGDMEDMQPYEEAYNMAIEALNRDAINTGETVTSGYIEPVGEDNNIPIKTTTVYPDNNDGMIPEYMIEDIKAEIRKAMKKSEGILWNRALFYAIEVIDRHMSGKGNE